MNHFMKSISHGISICLPLLFVCIFLQDVTQVEIPQKMQSAIKPLPKHIQPGYQEFQVALYGLLIQAKSWYHGAQMGNLCSNPACNIHVFSIKSQQTANVLNLQKVNSRQCVLCVQNVLEGQSAQDPVGRPMMHRTALSQATGEAVYCDDLPQTDGELFLVIVTSSRPHAKIT